MSCTISFKTHIRISMYINHSINSYECTKVEKLALVVLGGMMEDVVLLKSDLYII